MIAKQPVTTIADFFITISNCIILHPHRIANFSTRH